MSKSPKTQAWLSQFAESPTNQKILNLFSIRGLATIEQCQIPQSNLTQRQLRSLLASWSEEQVGKTPLLRTMRISYERQGGGLRLVYLLTETGASLLRQLTGQENILASRIESRVECVHAVAEMDVFARAQEANLDCFIEKPFFFGSQKENIRADVAFVKSENIFRVIEIEQAAQAEQVSRITDKLLRLMNFFRSSDAQQVENKILVLFNLANDDQQTISIWRKVVTALEKQHGPLPYQLLTAYLLDFLEQPVWQDWSEFSAIEVNPVVAEVLPQAADQIDIPVTAQAEPGEVIEVEPDLRPPFFRQHPAEASHFDIIMEVLKNDPQLRVSENAEANQHTFFNLALIIYAGSHYPDSPVVRKSAFPAISLALLYRYLHAIQNQALLEILKREVREVQRANARGVNMFRDAYSHLVWTLLRHYGFGRGGPLQVLVKVPSFNDERSDIYIDLKWDSDASMQEVYGLAVFALQKPAPKYEFLAPIHYGHPDNNWQVLNAAAWLLNALWVYMEDLGLKPIDRKKNP